MPFEFRDDICRKSLLRNTDVYILLGITDFRPASVMTADFRRHNARYAGRVLFILPIPSVISSS